MPDAAAQAAGLVQLADGVYGTSPTRVHEVLVQAEAGRWVAWAAYYHRSLNGGQTPMREWTLYRGADVKRAMHEAVRFARRFKP